jgi:hypothetical protein
MDGWMTGRRLRTGEGRTSRGQEKTEVGHKKMRGLEGEKMIPVE